MEGETALAPGGGTSPRGAAARRHSAQSLLGRSRHAARGSVSRGRRDGARAAAPGRRMSIAICAPRRKAAGTSARAGSPTARRSRTIRTTDFIPPDLNSLLYQLETDDREGLRSDRGRGVREGHALERAPSSARRQSRAPVERGERRVRRLRLARADRRSDAGHRRDGVSAVTSSLSDAATRRARSQRPLRATLLQPHGLATTTATTGQQWDAPNGWAPLQWLAIGGLRNYGEEALAGTIAQRWVAKNDRRSIAAPASWWRNTTSPVRRPAAAASIRCRTASAGPTACCAGCSRFTRSSLNPESRPHRLAGIRSGHPHLLSARSVCNFCSGQKLRAQHEHEYRNGTPPRATGRSPGQRQRTHAVGRNRLVLAAGNGAGALRRPCERGVSRRLRRSPRQLRRSATGAVLAD